MLNDRLQLLRATTFLMSGGDASLLAPEVQLKLSSLIQAPVEALQSKNQLEIIAAQLQKNLSLSEKNDISRAMGEQLQVTKKILTSDWFSTAKLADDSKDAFRGWGIELIPKTDPIFFEPSYLSQVMTQSSVSASGRSLFDPNHAFEQFAHALQKNAPVDILNLYQTGSDANNGLYHLASSLVRHRSNLPYGTVIDAEILAFEGIYAGGRGRISRASAISMDGKPHDYMIPSPTTKTWNPQNPLEVAELIASEEAALLNIRKKVTKSKKPIGGVLIEPMQLTSGFRFYRPEFMRKLRKLCDELRVPIFADEIMTGGGRTGKFFAFQNYEGFEPDYVTFGKGLQIAGIARFERSHHTAGAPPMPKATMRSNVTVQGPTDSLLKGAVILRHIYANKLAEHAEKVGAYFEKRLREVISDEKPLVRKGLTFAYHPDFARMGFYGSMGRFLFPLTVTEKDVDQWIEDYKIKKEKLK